MLTRCPKCHTLFRISETQLRQARGKTRCGQCYTVFEAQEAIVDEPATVQQQPAPAQSATRPAQPAQSAAGDPSLGDAASSIYNELVIKNRSVKYDIPEVEDESQPAMPAAASVPAPTRTPPPPAQNSQSAMRRIQELKRRAEGDQVQPQLTKHLNDQYQNTNLRNVNDQGHDIRFVPDVLQDDLYEEVHIPSAKSNFFMVLGIVLLLITLVTQYVYFMRVSLAENEEIRPYIVRFCKWLDCVVPFKKNTRRIATRPFLFELDPRNNNIGILRARFKNIARHTQPFPIVEIRVKSTAKDRVVAMIRIKPSEYLPRYVNPNAGFKSGAYVDLERRFVMPTDEPASVEMHFR